MTGIVLLLAGITVLGVGLLFGYLVYIGPILMMAGFGSLLRGATGRRPTRASTPPARRRRTRGRRR